MGGTPEVLNGESINRLQLEAVESTPDFGLVTKLEQSLA
jgi:hypothetical protein